MIYLAANDDRENSKAKEADQQDQQSTGAHGEVILKENNTQQSAC